MELMDHRLFPDFQFPPEVLYEERPVFDANQREVKGLHAVWITLNNPDQLNSYTTEMVKAVITAFQHAGMDRRAVAVVFTGEGNRAFCTGGNTREYAQYYAGRPMEYKQYMWLFNMMVNSILLCQLPVICRVNGMRLAGGQEIGMACDFAVAGDHATFGQAGPRHGSAPIGGSTDFLPLFVGIERAMDSAVLCQTWNAQQAKEFGLITDHVPVYKRNGEFIPNPLLTDIDPGDAKQIIKTECETDFSRLDQRVNQLITSLLLLMPDCVRKTIEEVRGPKWEQWARKFPSHRSWLGLNMMTDAQAGFTAFDQGTKESGRTVNFIRLRQLLAEGRKYDANLIKEVLPEGVTLQDF